MMLEYILLKIDALQYLQFQFPWIWYTGLVFIAIVFILLLRKTRSITSLILRTLCIASILAASAVPYKSTTSFLEAPHRSLLLDISMSMTEKAIEECTLRAKSLAPNSNLKIYPFSGTLHAPVEFDKDSTKTILAKYKDARNSSLTNFEESLRAFSNIAHSDEILLCSDGRESAGDVSNVLSELRRKSLRLFPILPDNRLLGPDDVIITSLSGPFIANRGDPVSFTASVRNPTVNSFSAKGDFLISGKSQTQKNLSIESGNEALVSHVFKDIPVGLHKITFSIPGDKGDSRSRWIEIKEKPKILIVHGKSSEQNLSENLLRTLGYDRDSIILSQNRIPAALSPYTGVILNNVPQRSLTGAFMGSLKKFIEEGGALLILGGDSSFGLGGYAGSILDELSPLSSVPPRKKVERLPSAVILVIDKSGSMNEQGRMMSARLAALNAIQGLKDEDFVSVIGFDHAPLVVMDLQKVSVAKQQAEIRLRNLKAKGGTNLLPALSRARFRLSNAPAGKKHIIVLTDGIFPHTGNAFANEINAIKREGITMSTIALGMDADVPLLKLLAKQGSGSFYQVVNPSTLPRIFLDDIKIATGEDTMKEQSDFPVLPGPSGIVSSQVSNFPFLKGFVETREKPGAQVELVTKKGDANFPLFASWLYGKGRVFAFASDLQGRWTSPWLKWPQIGNFWDDIFRKLKGTEDSTTEDIRFDIRYHVEGTAISMELLVYEKELGQVRNAKGVLQQKNGVPSSFSFERKEPGRFQALTSIKEPGDYMISATLEETPLPPVWISISPRELGEVKGLGSNIAFLSMLGRESKGRLNPRVEDLASFEKKEIITPETYSLPFVLLSFILILLEVLFRERFRKRA
jgi:Ca-activated chloride channel family protein